MAFVFDRSQPELAAEFAVLAEKQAAESTIPPPFDPT
jgi:hypothetical protein